jgi:hypothetical protein
MVQEDLYYAPVRKTLQAVLILLLSEGLAGQNQQRGPLLPVHLGLQSGVASVPRTQEKGAGSDKQGQPVVTARFSFFFFPYKIP